MRGLLFLAMAICCEVSGTTCMKLSHTSPRWILAALIPAFYLGTLAFMWLAFRYLEMGFVYAVWSGIGTAAAAIIGILLFHESFNSLKGICLVLIIIGVVGLHVAVEPGKQPPPAVGPESP